MTKTLKANLYIRNDAGALVPSEQILTIETLPDKEFLGYDGEGRFWSQMMNEKWAHHTKDTKFWADEIA